MRLVRPALCQVLVAALPCALVASTSWATQIQPPPSERDPGELAKVLRRHGMTELMAELARTLSGSHGAKSADALHVVANTWVALANEPGRPAEKQKAWLDRAEAAYEKLIPMTAQPVRGRATSAEEAKSVIRHCRIRLEYGTLLLGRAATAAEPMLHLVAAPTDRHVVYRRAAKASAVLGTLLRDIAWHIADLYRHRGLLTWARPLLEDIQLQAEHRAAWVNFYAAAALNDRGIVANATPPARTGSPTRPGKHP